MLRKAFGGAFIAMNSRDLGADYTFAWPGATLGVMGAKQAVGIVNRRDIAAADDPEMAREEFAARYTEEHLSAGTAAAEGYVDEVIEPIGTRRRLIEALNTLDSVAAPAAGSNIPMTEAQATRVLDDRPRVLTERPIPLMLPTRSSSSPASSRATRSRGRSPARPRRPARRSC